MHLHPPLMKYTFYKVTSTGRCGVCSHCAKVAKVAVSCLRALNQPVNGSEVATVWNDSLALFPCKRPHPVPSKVAMEKAWGKEGVVADALVLYRSDELVQVLHHAGVDEATESSREKWKAAYSIVRSELKEMLDTPPGMGRENYLAHR